MAKKYTEEWKARVKALADKLDSDGCTASPDLFYGPCCEAHDIAYRTGLDENGKPITRLKADNRLFKCMKKMGKTPILGRFLLPLVYWTAVRVAAGKQWKGS